jgi:hypothetical protein
VEKLLGKALGGDTALPTVRIKMSQKAQRGVLLDDLADYIDKRRATAVKECHQLAASCDKTWLAALPMPTLTASLGSHALLCPTSKPFPSRS